ncbi:MAG: U32 family peptidase [Syntrophomonadaceae bacterium]|nr:U32 family peptidase [Syntrophomonadaceae bacterium]
MTLLAKPELVAPAGNIEKLKAALNFGADAVYLGGQEFGLRAMSDNFSPGDMAEGVKVAHGQGRRVYVTVNIFAHNRDIEMLPEYLSDLQQLQVDGLIISDPGVFLQAKEYAPSLPVTVSTQANVTNYMSAEFYRRQGASRIVLARELTLAEIAYIKEKVAVDVEVFVHGAMCLSYSGRCWLSQAMTGRDANQGLCAHPCRYRYVLQEEKRPGEYFSVDEDDRGSYVMNSKDLCMISFLKPLMEAGVDAFKIEGRMKSPYYVGAVVKVYREAIDTIAAGIAPRTEKWTGELERVATRPFTAGFAAGKPLDAQDVKRSTFPRQVLFCGVVMGRDNNTGRLLVQQRAPFGIGDRLEYLEPGKAIKTEVVKGLFNSEHEEIMIARHPQELVWLDSEYDLQEGSMLGKLVDNDR